MNEKTKTPAPKMKLCGEQVDFANILPFRMRFFRRLNELGVFRGVKPEAGGKVELSADRLWPFFKCLVWELFPGKTEEEITQYADDIPIAEMQPLVEWAQAEMQEAGFADVDRPT